MVRNRLVARDRLFPLPAVGLKDFVEGAALHTSRKSVWLIGTTERGGFSGALLSPEVA